MKRPAFLPPGQVAPARFSLAPRLPCTCSASSQPLSHRAVDMKLDVGTRVRVKKSIQMYHYPGQRNTAIDVEGFEGVIVKDKSTQDGVVITATAPYFVDFAESHPKFRAHFEESELEVLEEN